MMIFQEPASPLEVLPIVQSDKVGQTVCGRRELLSRPQLRYRGDAVVGNDF